MSQPHRIFLFNPETDFARALTAPGYAPKKNVVALRRSLQLLPLLFANPSDFLAIFLDNNRPSTEIQFHSAGKILESLGGKANLFKALSTIPHSPFIYDIPVTGISLENVFEELSPVALNDFGKVEPTPWGWDFSIREVFAKAGISRNFLPSDDSLNLLRALSGRDTARRFNNLLLDLDPDIKATPARSLSAVDDVLHFCQTYPEVWLKAPWSSSGRGILRTADSSEEIIRQWSQSVIRHQGLVSAEIFQPKACDFASEWIIDEYGVPVFLGFSFFHISARGKFAGNLVTSQSEIVRLIRQHTSEDLQHIVNLQQRALKLIVGNDYSGPLGIDMMARADDGSVNPCVEINFRLTMGHAALEAYKILQP